MGHVAAHAATDYTVPSWQVHCIKLCFNDFSDVVEYAFLLECKRDAVYCMLLHLVRHVATFYNGVCCLLLVNVTMGLYCILVVYFGFPLFSRCNSRVSLC